MLPLAGLIEPMERQRATVLGLTACALGAAVRDARRKAAAATATTAVVGAAGAGGGDGRSGAGAPFRLGYVTDVEGNLDYFARFVDICPVLSYAGGANAGDPGAGPAPPTHHRHATTTHTIA